MKLTFLGGADEVGASCTLIEIAGKRILVDAGIRISPKASRGIENSQLPDLQPITAMGGIDYLLVTHAHTDHTGALPLITSHYPHIPVYMTRPTEALVRVLQKDAQRIMTSNFEEEGELPLFDEIAVDRMLEAVQLVEFNQPINLGEGIQVTYHVSGHIAGAAMLVIESVEGTLVMSGDVSKSAQRTVESVHVPKIKANALVLESTYGNRLHANREAEERRLMDTLQRVTERGGRVLIPAFALGRAQEIIQIILAYRDRFDMPVYVDGMVRSVCDAYARFKDLLPPKTVRMAGEDHLFFRDKIKPVRSAQHRMELAMSSAPCVIVASSGMLTGGASSFFARYIAPEPQSAILLTGYQDEEAPGKLLQRLMKERQEGSESTIKLDKGNSVPVRCEIDSYSLSAHADQNELLSIAQAFKADEVMLVHGDAAARHALATELRQRQIIVTSPKIGTTREFKFQAKPWAIGAKQASGAHTGGVTLGDLWQSLKLRAGNYFSIRELAQVWWGDGERAAEMGIALMHPDNIYFTADWRSKTSYMVKSEDQVQRAVRQRQIMLAHPDLVGKLVVLRNSNNQPRVGVVKSAEVDSFEADVYDGKGTHYPGDALLWVIGDWSKIGSAGQGSIKAQVQALVKQAKAVQDDVFTFFRRQQLVNVGEPVQPELLIPATLPEGVTHELALLAIVLALAADGASLEPDGLKPKRALEHGALEQNDAQQIAKQLFPPEARLRRVGMEVQRKRMVLHFDFPQTAERKYIDLLKKLSETTGWEVEIRPTVNQQALSSAVAELLPAEARITKGPSFFIDQREVHVEVAGVEDTTPYARTYLELTDFKLVVTKPKQVSVAAIQPAEQGTQLEINHAFAVIQQALNPLGLYKASLKQGQIVLAFVSPQVGERHIERINELSKITGYGLSIHPHPNQQQILLTLRQLTDAAGWQIRKGPGIHVDRAEIALSLSTPPDEAQAEQIKQALYDQTGYRLELS